MTNLDLFNLRMEASNHYSDDNEDQDMGFRDGYREGFLKLGQLITNHLKSLPLDQMSGKQVEESLWNEFLHIQ